MRPRATCIQIREWRQSIRKRGRKRVPVPIQMRVNWCQMWAGKKSSNFCMIRFNGVDIQLKHWKWNKEKTAKENKLASKKKKQSLNNETIPQQKKLQGKAKTRGQLIVASMIQRFLRGKKHLAYENTLIINAVGRRFLHPRGYLRRVRERFAGGLAQMLISPRPLAGSRCSRPSYFSAGKETLVPKKHACRRNPRADETLVPKKRSCRNAIDESLLRGHIKYWLVPLFSAFIRVHRFAVENILVLHSRSIRINRSLILMWA